MQYNTGQYNRKLEIRHKKNCCELLKPTEIRATIIKLLYLIKEVMLYGKTAHEIERLHGSELVKKKKWMFDKDRKSIQGDVNSLPFTGFIFVLISY